MNATIEIVPGNHVEQPERDARDTWFVIGDPKCRGGRLIDEQIVRKVTMEIQSPYTLFRQQSGQHDQTQHHGQQQVEQIIAGIDGGDPNRQGQQQEAGAFRGDADGAVAEESTDQRLEALGCHGDKRLYTEWSDRDAA